MVVIAIIINVAHIVKFIGLINFSWLPLLHEILSSTFMVYLFLVFGERTCK